MAYKKNLFTLCCFVQFILAYTSTIVNVTEIKGNLPDASIISRIFQEFLSPVMRSFPKNNYQFKHFEETLIDKAIREKVKELQPLLQDNDAMNDDETVMLKDKDETTIIEFLPKTEERKNIIQRDSFKSHLKKYKKIRAKINTALTKESVSGKTKNLVVKTLDGLIKTLLSSQCKWKRNLRAAKAEKQSDIENKLNTGLQNIKDALLSFIRNKSVHRRRNDDDLKFLNTVQTIFRSITDDDVDVISNKYKILCEFVPKENINIVHPEEMNVSALRNNWDKTDLEEDRCYNVVVCSNELKQFMRNFYLALNDTAVSVFKNYVEMYTRDVIVDDENEKDIIISVLNKMTTGIEEGMSNVFIKEIKKLVLDRDKRIQANVIILSSYVTNTISSVKKFAKQLLKSELLVLREKILSVILDDLNVNLDVDLGNLEREFIGNICAKFHLCNSRYRGRRQGSNNVNKNNLNVQLQLILDKGMSDVNSFRKLHSNVVTSRNNTAKKFTSSIKNITVTRTTLLNVT